MRCEKQAGSVVLHEMQRTVASFTGRAGSEFITSTNALGSSSSLSAMTCTSANEALAPCTTAAIERACSTTADAR
eukprot:CAMPEP_0181202732 /NCGR_PEP_ID=MMETSP1096-20121128/19007_1 /TAXON_ID=156174 ORGANISM="Chrysochromulina ericina, Strain CCMP281" /NCGR_SAMPLE_ID=MMETSP1096 /ASSEMBLY_ACC=CAM_ASM_000453 /LENGTH=74 /DNA_ID=CAMNT_0023293281 /DNA_START=612 /DNA_END=832 /DNA_ORIENTATION=+